MKRFLIPLIVLIVFAFSACVSTQEYTKLEDRIAKLERDVKLKGLESVGASFRPYTKLHGGTANCLDKTDGATLSFGDVAFVSLDADAVYGTVLFTYVYRDFGTSTDEALPFIVKPATNPDNEHGWALASASTSPPVVVTTTPYSLSAAEARSGMVQMTVTGELDLPAAATVGFGTTLCVIARDAEVMTIDPNGSEKLFVSGVGVQAGGVSTTSDGAIGDYACFVSMSDIDASGTDGWWMVGYGLTAWNAGT